MLRTLALCLTVLVSPPLLANTACPEHFAAGKAPVITNPKMQARMQEVCFQVFAVLHSGNQPRSTLFGRAPSCSNERGRLLRWLT